MDLTILVEQCLEKYVKKVLGNTEMEDALKRLDRLTQEEARMAAAENLKLTHAVDKRVEGVADRVAGVDEHVAVVTDQVAAVDDRVASVNEHVADVVDQVAGVDERIAGVDDRVAGVEECVASVVNQVADVDDRVAGVDDRVQQTANDVDQMKRSSSLDRTSTNRLSNLTHPFREPTPRECSQMALSTGSLNEPQHRMWHSSQKNSDVVFGRQPLSGVEVYGAASLGPRKTFAPSSFRN